MSARVEGADAAFSSPLFMGAALLVATNREGSWNLAGQGVEGLVKSFLPCVAGYPPSRTKDAGGSAGAVSGKGGMAVGGAGVGGLDINEDPPLVLKMRAQAPPSFWDPESPVVPSTFGDDNQEAAHASGNFSGEWAGRVAGRDWAASPRMQAVRSKGSSKPPQRRLSPTAEFPSGPAGPDGPAGPGVTDASRGRPEWQQMLMKHKSGSDDESFFDSDDGGSVKSNDDPEDPEMQKVTDDDVRALEKRAGDRALAVRAAMTNRTLSYKEYLHLEKVLQAQYPQSAIFDQEVHDEMLFIIIHQTYELWFKQMLHELDSMHEIFERGVDQGFEQDDINVCVGRAARCVRIMKVLVQQMDVLETMDPLSFLDFRDFLQPASGFQSVQFRKIENKLGLRQEQRIQHSGCPYHQHLASRAEQEEALESEKGRSVAQLLGQWLGGLLEEVAPGWDFASYMRRAIEQAAEHDREAIREYPHARVGVPGAPQGKAAMLAELEVKREAHLKLFDRGAHDELVRKGIRQFSFEATMACVFIQSFPTEQALQSAHRLVMHLVEMDDLLLMWRQRHSMVVMRMVGTKSGTGGSSGHAYLNAVIAKARIFTDLCHSSHYLLPRASMPPLPLSVSNRLAMIGLTKPTLQPRGERAKSFS
uniref:Tryptophan 2,3-dioxygenase n=1 Tax=Hemiselmis andersenii TaxID=464988 RepID=A0A6U5CG48_HEMAN